MNAKELRQMVDGTNEKLRVLFRKQRQMRLYRRRGVIIVVDDCFEHGDLLRHLLDSVGVDLNVITVSTVVEAKQVVAEHKPDGVRIMIIDIGLSGDGQPDGLDLIKWIRSENLGIPFVVSTGKIDRVDEVKKLVPGVDVFVKGTASLADYLDAIGLDVDSGGTVPSDDELD